MIPTYPCTLNVYRLGIVIPSYSKFFADIFCPFETFYIFTDSFSPPNSKQLKRLKERAYKCGEKTKVRSLSISIGIEINCFNKKYTVSLIGIMNCGVAWKVIKQFGVLISKIYQTYANVDKLSQVFTVGKLLPAVVKFNSVDSSPLLQKFFVTIIR